MDGTGAPAPAAATASDDITPETERLFVSADAPSAEQVFALEPEPEPAGKQGVPQSWSDAAMIEEGASLAGAGAAYANESPAGAAATIGGDEKGMSFFLDPKFVRHLTKVFTPRFVCYIGFSHHLVKGVLAGGGSSGMVLSQRNIYVIKGVPAREKQMFQAAASTPWAIKPVFGLLNDCLPIAGWEKSLYLLGVACAGSAAWLTIGVFGERLPGEAICICFFAILAQVAWTDLMVEGLYTVRMKQNPQYGSDLVTYVWSGITFCGAIGVLLAGPAIDLLGAYNVSFIAVPLAFAIVIPTLLGWHGEKRLPPSKRGVNWMKIKEQRDVVITAAVLGVSCVLTAVSAIAGTGDNAREHTQPYGIPITT